MSMYAIRLVDFLYCYNLVKFIYTPKSIYHESKPQESAFVTLFIGFFKRLNICFKRLLNFLVYSKERLAQDYVF